MQRRQITMEDGRYLIFYTFDEETAAPAHSNHSGDEEQSSSRRAEPDAEPQAEEERRV